MKFTVSQLSLTEALVAPVRVANAKATTQAVGGVLIQSYGDHSLVLSGTDGDTTVRVAVRASVQEQGVALVPGRKLADVTRMLEGEEILFESDGNRMRMSCGLFNGAMSVLPVGNFPSLGMPEGSEMVVDSADLIKAINQVVPACSTNEKRPALAGVRLISTPDTLTLVATDNSRIAIRSMPVQGGVETSHILPRAALLEVLRVKSDKVTIIFTERGREVTFKTPGLLVTTRPVAGKFPNHEKIVPESTESSATVMREPFINAVRRVSAMSEEHSPIRLSFGMDMMQMRLASEDGQTHEIFPATIGGEPIEIAFNAQFLLDGLYGVDTRAVFIQANGPTRPALISSDGDGLNYVLMPVRIAAKAVAA